MARQAAVGQWGAVVVVAIGILIASLLSPPVDVGSSLGPLSVVGADKWAHAIGYGLLAGTLAIALGGGSFSERMVIALAFGLTMSYGLGIELLQLTVPRRQFDLFDLVANGAGAVVAVTGWWVVLRRWR